MNNNGFGGVLVLEQAATATVSNSRFASNVGGFGGVIYMEAKSLTVSNCSFTRNSGFHGGVAHVKGESQVLWQHCNFTNNKATEAGAVFAVGRSNHTLALCLLTDNNATIGGAIRAAQQSQVALISTLLQQNSAPQQTRGDGGYGSGISIEEDSQLAILGSSSVSSFVSRLESDQSMLPVRLNVSGPFGLPCDGQLVQALLNGTQVLGVNCSDSSGVVLMRLHIRQPPGLYVISFNLVPGDGQKALDSVKPANFSLQVRSCIVGEVTPAPDACQACPEGSFSLEPHKRTCDSCPASAVCPGGFAIVPLQNMWHSSPESPQVHR
uniref:Right handed beta helix domain-containing protein n=1 Tax=Tetradesmus obliquus TaxID=3088 RepID=A0A383V4V4_TETOB|eukprot:jgi/Sobl393_1/14380/SZX60635.1